MSVLTREPERRANDLRRDTERDYLPMRFNSTTNRTRGRPCLPGCACKRHTARGSGQFTAARMLGNKFAVKHGHWGTRTWMSWYGMMMRCYVKTTSNYERYGGRGVVVCERWRKTFLNFLADMGERPEGKPLDRIDTYGNYEPSNCRWGTPKQQMRNTTRNIYIEIDGVRRCASEWCEVLGLDRVRIYEKVGTRKGYVKPFPTVEAAIRHFYREKHNSS